MEWTNELNLTTVLRSMEQQRRRQLGERVHKLRIARGWTVEHLAHEAGIAAKTVSRLQNARGETRASTVRKVARALEVDERELVGIPAGSPEVLSQLDRIEAKIDELLARQ